MTSETTDVVETEEKVEETAVATRPVGQQEGVDLHPQDLRPAIIALSQDQSTRGEPGKYVRLDTEEVLADLKIIPIRVQKTRTLWPEGPFSKDRQPVCWSADGVLAADGVDPTLGYPGGTCATCKVFTAKPWEVAGEDGWCMPGYNVIMLDADSWEPLGMRLNGKAARIGARLGNAGVFRRAILELSSERVVDTKGNYYVMKVKTLSQLDRADQDLAKENGQAFQHVDISVDPKDEGDTEDAGPADPVEPEDPMGQEQPPLDPEDLPF